MNILFPEIAMSQKRRLTIVLKSLAVGWEAFCPEFDLRGAGDTAVDAQQHLAGLVEARIRESTGEELREILAQEVRITHLEVRMA